MSEALCGLIGAALVARELLQERWWEPFPIGDDVPRADVAELMVRGGKRVCCGGQYFRAMVREEAGHRNLYVLKVVCP